jgi:hypothetical protein
MAAPIVFFPEPYQQNPYEIRSTYEILTAYQHPIPHFPRNPLPLFTNKKRYYSPVDERN